jgi:hypothetical protein
VRWAIWAAGSHSRRGARTQCKRGTRHSDKADACSYRQQLSRGCELSDHFTRANQVVTLLYTSVDSWGPDTGVNSRLRHCKCCFSHRKRPWVPLRLRSNQWSYIYILVWASSGYAASDAFVILYCSFAYKEFCSETQLYPCIARSPFVCLTTFYQLRRLYRVEWKYD